MVPILVVGMLNVNTFRRTTFLREDPALCVPEVCEMLMDEFPPSVLAPSSPGLSFVMNSFPKQVGAHRLESRAAHGAHWNIQGPALETAMVEMDRESPNWCRPIRTLSLQVTERRGRPQGRPAGG